MMQFSAGALRAVLLLLAGGSTAAHPRELRLAQIIDAHTRARGGATRLDSVTSIRNDSEIEEPGFKVVGRYYARADGQMRVDIFSECKRVFSEGIDDRGGWSWGGGDTMAKAAREAGKAALLHGIEFNLFGLHRYGLRGHRIELLGHDATVPGRPYLLKITMNDGFITYRTIDPKTFMITGSRDYRAFHPDEDQTKKWVETRYSDFRAVRGIVSPFSSEQWDGTSDTVIGHGRVLRLIYNPPIPAGYFSRSSPIQPLCKERHTSRFTQPRRPDRSGPSRSASNSGGLTSALGR